MLSGTRLFAGETVSDVLAAVLTREPDWKALPTATPALVRRLLSRCLDRDPKRRLRDIGEAALLLANPGPADEGPEPTAGARSSARERAAWAIAALALVLAVVMAVRGRPGRGTAGPLYFSLSTALSEQAPEAAVISPDGTRVAFVGRLPRAATDTIFVRSLREAVPKSLAGTEGVTGLAAFSPDGKWLVYISHNRGLKKVPVDGGSPVDLASGNFRWAQAAWMETGRILITVFNWEQPGALYEVPETGGSPTAIPGRKELAAEAATYPRPLPGGRAVLLQTGRGQSSLSVQSLDTGERKVLAQNSRSARFVGGSIVWLENDKLMAAPFDLGRLEFSGPPVAIPIDALSEGGPLEGFDVSANGSLLFLHAAKPSVAAMAPEANRRLIWIDRSGKRTPGPSTDPVHAAEPRLSPDDTRAIVDGPSGQSGSDVWTVDLQRGTLLRLSFTNGEDETGVWSPDGGWIAWAASRTGQGRALYRRRSDGSGKEEKLWDSEGLHCHAAVWTPDGKGILMTVDSPKTGFDVVLVTLDPKPLAKPLLTDPFNETSVRISPDGRWIVYASDESGRSEIYAQAFPDLGNKIQISLTGGQEPVWRPSGGEIVYRSTASRDFMSVTVEAKGALAVAPPRVLASDVGLSRGDIDHTHYAVARDGRLLTIQAAPSAAKSDLGFVLGWAQDAGLIK
jgi:serine/threonine-protein kinase